MASVGNIQVTTFAGRMIWPQTATGIIPGMPGTLGDGVLRANKKTPAEVSIPTGVQIAGTLADGHNIADAYRTLVDGPPITVVDSVGKTWPGVVVLGVMVEVTQLALTNQVRVDAVWRFKIPATGPQ